MDHKRSRVKLAKGLKSSLQTHSLHEFVCFEMIEYRNITCSWSDIHVYFRSTIVCIEYCYQLTINMH